MNLYAYCKNNPVVYYDPSGHKKQHKPQCKEEMSERENGVEEGGKTTRRQNFRDAKVASGIPKSAQYNTHKFVYDSGYEDRIVYDFDVNGQKKYIIEHPFDKNGRGVHFHGADTKKGSPFNKGKYNQYDGHFPEDINGFAPNRGK